EAERQETDLQRAEREARAPDQGMRGRRMRVLRALIAAMTPAALTLALPIPAGAAEIVPLVQGLTFTVTSHVGLVSNRGSVPVADTEIVYSIEGMDASRMIL